MDEDVERPELERLLDDPLRGDVPTQQDRLGAGRA